MIRVIEIWDHQDNPVVFEPTIVLINHFGRQDWRYCRFCDTGQQPRDSVFSINHEGDAGLYYWNDLVSPGHPLIEAIGKESFFDALSERYPEFAEWLLFHQEWF